jgi:fructan beta-fructosidase
MEKRHNYSEGSCFGENRREILYQLITIEELNVLEAAKIDIVDNNAKLNGGAKLRITADKIADFAITLSNDSSEKTVVGFDKAKNQYYIDRSASGKTKFEKGFASRTTAPRVAITDSTDITLVIDVASVELFADRGVTVMTGIFFPTKDYSKISIEPKENFKIKTVELTELKPMN